jgi:hypothetical protein
VTGEGLHDAVDGLEAIKRCMAQCGVGEDAEPYLDLIEPTAVLGCEHEPNARMTIEPSPSGRAGPGADVVSDDDEAASTVEANQVIEERQHIGNAAI